MRSIATLKPRQSATCALVGFRSTAVPRQIRIGTSDDLHVKLIEQLLRGGVSVEIEIRIGIPVARQELLQAQRAGRVRGSDEHDVAAARATSATRRRMNARISTSLNSESVCTSDRS